MQHIDLKGESRKISTSSLAACQRKGFASFFFLFGVSPLSPFSHPERKKCNNRVGEGREETKRISHRVPPTSLKYKFRSLLDGTLALISIHLYISTSMILLKSWQRRVKKLVFTLVSLSDFSSPLCALANERGERSGASGMKDFPLLKNGSKVINQDDIVICRRLILILFL